MIRTFITPGTSEISLKIPDEYVGRQIEIIAFSLEEVTTLQYPDPAALIQDWCNSDEDKAWKDL